MTQPLTPAPTASAGVESVPMLVGGKWTTSSSPRGGDVYNPSTGKVIARVPFATAAEVNQAIESAAAALPDWANKPVVQRCHFLFRFRELLVAHAEEIARSVTREHGKTLVESRASVQRGIEVVECAGVVPSLIMGQSIHNIARAVDCETIRHPVGEYAGITQFESPT